MSNVRDIIIESIHGVANKQGKQLVPLTDSVPLLQSGLDSLCVAILVADLEEKLGVDPFSVGDETEVPQTIGDFIRVYENAVSQTTG